MAASTATTAMETTTMMSTGESYSYIYIFTACFMIYLILMLNGFRSNKNVDEKRMPATIFFLGYGIKLTQRNFDNKHLCIRNVDDTKSRKMLRRNELKKKKNILTVCTWAVI